MNATRDDAVKFKQLAAGWLDTSIQEFLSRFPRRSRSAAYAYVTMLDSDPSPRKLLRSSPELKGLDRAARPLGKGFIVATPDLLDAVARTTVFHGFDEVWFFPTDDVPPKPVGVSIVGPRRIDQSKLNRVGRWMIENRCPLALGDGAGLNVVVKARGFIRHLLASSMSQSPPSG